MPRCCLNLLVLVASAVIVASDGDLANDVEQPVAETERAVTALAELFYKRTSFSCKMACGKILHQDNALYYTTCELLKLTKNCHHAIQPWLLYLLILVALALIGNCVVSCFSCGQRRKNRTPTVDDMQYEIQSVPLEKAGETVVDGLDEQEST